METRILLELKTCRLAALRRTDENLEEIKEAVSWIGEKGNPLSLLHCVLNYPTPDKNANLGMIMDLKAQFPDKIIGYSDLSAKNELETSLLKIPSSSLNTP